MSFVQSLLTEWEKEEKKISNLLNLWEKNMREKRITWPKVLYFGNDIAEIGERWGKKIVWFLAMVLLKNERREIFFFFFLHFGKIGGREEREKNLSLCFIWIFLIFQKFIPLFYSTHIETKKKKKKSGVR